MTPFAHSDKFVLLILAAIRDGLLFIGGDLLSPSPYLVKTDFFLYVLSLNLFILPSLDL